MTEGPTLLPHVGSDKRTKEVFAMYLQRMNARMGRGFARVMDGLDGGLSVRGIGRCERKPVAAAAPDPMTNGTVAKTATVHVMNRYFSFWLKALFLPGFHGKRPESRKQWRCLVHAIGDRFQRS